MKMLARLALIAVLLALTVAAPPQAQQFGALIPSIVEDTGNISAAGLVSSSARIVTHVPGKNLAFAAQLFLVSGSITTVDVRMACTMDIQAGSITWANLAGQATSAGAVFLPTGAEGCQAVAINVVTLTGTSPVIKVRWRAN